MKHIFSNLKGYWHLCILIVMLLAAQAYCDLSLPDYTSKVIDVGIANSGIEYSVPEYLSSESYMGLGMILDEAEKKEFLGAYELDEKKGYYVLKDNSTENVEALDESYRTPIAIYYMLTGQKDVAMSEGANKEEMIKMLAELGVNPLSPTFMVDLRKALEKEIEKLGDTVVASMGKYFAKAEYEKCDIDVVAIQNKYLWKAGGKMLLVSLVMVVLAIVTGYVASRVAAGAGRDLRSRIFTKVMGFSNAQLDKFSTASLITRSTNDVQQIQIMTVMLLRMVLYAPILAIGGIINIQKYKSGMTWVIVVAIAAVICVIAFLLVVAMPKFKMMQNLVDKVNLVAREILTGLPVIRAFSREKREEERFDEANTELTNVMLFVNRVMAFMMPVIMLIMNGVSILIVWVGSKKIDAGVLEVGSMTAFITYSMVIIMSFLMVTMLAIMLPRAAVAAERIHEVLISESTIVEAKDAADVNTSDATVVFDNVSFKYPDGEDNVLEGIDFVAKPGQTTAIIGSTGCGKSTLIKLIPRFYDVTTGKITVGGKDVRDVTIKSLRDEIGYVPQKAVLFSGDIQSNITYGAKDTSLENVKEAASVAQARDFIEEKESNYKSSIAQGGTNVSGGQKQRLSIARAIARNPKIYIFDDSFSALDFKTDTALRKELAKKTKDATVIIVAQRVSTILNAEQIIVLEEGKMIGKGTHRELVKTCEAYKQIAQSQLSEAEFEKSIAPDGKEEF